MKIIKIENRTKFKKFVMDFINNNENWVINTIEDRMELKESKLLDDLKKIFSDDFIISNLIRISTHSILAENYHFQDTIK